MSLLKTFDTRMHGNKARKHESKKVVKIERKKEWVMERKIVLT